ncbi:hypothetical protein BG003_008546 [Podila horticola]|nr:hypothetical protein BG003_008546 [Podila horticola]
MHVQGSQRPSNTRGPCSLISDKATEIAQTREVVDDEEKPINYRPVDHDHDLPECDEITDKETLHEILTKEVVDKIIDDEQIIDDEEGDVIMDEEMGDDIINEDNIDLNSNDDEVVDPDNDDDENNLKSILKAEDQALKVAIKTLKKRRAHIKRRLAQ